MSRSFKRREFPNRVSRELLTRSVREGGKARGIGETVIRRGREKGREERREERRWVGERKLLKGGKEGGGRERRGE